MALWRVTLSYVSATLVVLFIVTVYLLYLEADDTFSVGWLDDDDKADYEEMMRKDGFVLLSLQELRELLDVTFYDVTNEWVIYYDAKGNGRFLSRRIWFSDGTFTDTGYREITEDGRYCTKWKKLRGGRRRCGRVWRKGELHYGMLRHGWIGSKYTVRPGNVEGL